MRLFLLFGGILAALSGAFASEKNKNPSSDLSLPVPVELQFKVDFWKAIYTKYTTKQGVLHDAEDLSIIYDAIELPSSGDTTGVDQLRGDIRDHIFNIIRKKGENLTSEERRILSKFPAQASRARLLQATENIRFQLGQADRFKQGVIRSGFYLKHIERILAEEGVPDFIKYLPHVESSFQEFAISKFDAAGLWQLMPSTGKMFGLREEYTIDERLDPMKATRVAARHLLRDYKRLGNWPLAVTAYNHGAGGMSRAVQTLGTTDIAEIAFRFQSPSFGFASRNFYVQFLAAVDVATHYQRYFGDLPVPPPIQFETVQIKDSIYLKDFAEQYRFTSEEFRRLNPGLRPPVFNNSRPIPRGAEVRVPPNSHRVPILIASLDRQSVKAAAKAQKTAKLPELKVAKAAPSKPISKLKDVVSPYAIQDVAEGRGWVSLEINESISQMADWLKVSVDDLRNWNGMDAQAQARLGQRLLIQTAKVNTEEFQTLREDYHRQIKEDFFAQFEIAKLLDYEVKKGENLWSICYQKFDIPPWLLKEYNSNITLLNLTPGTHIKVPVLREKNGVALVGSSQ